MITALFRKKDGVLCGFRISGHSGYSGQGSDIVCAAVSAMTMLTVNTSSEVLGDKANVVTDEADASVDFTLCAPGGASSSLIEGLKRELEALAHDYPDNIRVVAQ